ncbi:MAG: hypothetical protein K0B02_01665 [DPANN group archaeon]|nr:hypothetical protein [DPANN group archaeon]
MTYTIRLEDINNENIHLVGMKALTLTRLIKSNISVPEGFVLTNKAFEAFLADNNIYEVVMNANEIDVNNHEILFSKTKEIRDLILSGKISKEMKDEIKIAYETLGNGKGLQGVSNQQLNMLNASNNDVSVCIRPSIYHQKDSKISFNGFMTSSLYVNGLQGIIDKIKQCWISAFTPEAIFAFNKYSKNNEINIAVIIQVMIDADKSGTVTTINTITDNQNEIMIESCFGPGIVTTDEITPDVYILEKDNSNLKGKKINQKEWRFIKHAISGDIIKENLELDKRFKESLSEEEVKFIFKIALKIEKIQGPPQSIEWAIKRDRLYIVQSSPIKSHTKTISQQNIQNGNILLNGIGISLGYGQGNIKIIHGISDYSKINAGDIISLANLNKSIIYVINRLSGIIIEQGSITGHMSTLCRECSIPLLIKKESKTELEEDKMVIINTLDGTVTELPNTMENTNQHQNTQPMTNMSYTETPLQTQQNVHQNSQNEQSNYSPQQNQYTPISAQIQQLDRQQSIEQKDEQKIDNMAQAQTTNNNDVMTATKVMLFMESYDDLNQIPDNCDGIGIIPSEVIVLKLGKIPYKIIDEGMEDNLIKYLEDHLLALAEKAYPNPVVYRLFGIKSNILKQIPGSETEKNETNPITGWSGTRRAIDDPKMFYAEIKAIERVINRGYNNIQILLPFIHDTTEVQTVRNMITNLGIESDKLNIGINIEIPSSAFLANDMAACGVSFAAIDADALSEHMLAVDRDNIAVNKHFNSEHKSVLRLIHQTIKEYKNAGIKVSIYGSILKNHNMIEKFVQFGIDSLIVKKDDINMIKYITARSERKLLLDILRAKRERYKGEPDY